MDLDTPAAEELRAQLVSTNRRFDAVCERGARRHDQLHRALVDSGDLYKVIQDLFTWLEETELQVRSNEPVDMLDKEALRDKYHKLRVRYVFNSVSTMRCVCSFIAKYGINMTVSFMYVLLYIVCLYRNICLYGNISMTSD